VEINYNLKKGFCTRTSSGDVCDESFFSEKARTSDTLYIILHFSLAGNTAKTPTIHPGNKIRLKITTESENPAVSSNFECGNPIRSSPSSSAATAELAIKIFLHVDVFPISPVPSFPLLVHRYRKERKLFKFIRQTTFDAQIGLYMPRHTCWPAYFRAHSFFFISSFLFLLFRPFASF
jgi:hypothetical protein